VPGWRNGRRTGLKIPRWQHCAGSSPALGTKFSRKTVQDCIFCKIICQKIPSKIIRETENIIVLQDIAPKAPIHFLIIPKKHIRDLVSCEKQDISILSEILIVAQTLAQEIPNAASFKLIMNNGYAAGQRVFHLHVHFLAGIHFAD